MATIDLEGYRFLIRPANDFERARALKLHGANWRQSGVVTLPLNILGWYQVTEEFPQHSHTYDESVLWWREGELWLTEIGRSVNTGQAEFWDMPDLWEHQGQALVRIEHGSVAIFDDMGMGKTRTVIEAIRRAVTDGDPTTAVVVCSKRVRGEWIAATERWWQPGRTVAPEASTWSKAAEQVGTAAITILTYESLLNADIQKAVEDLNPTWLVVDEAHNLKKRSRTNKKETEEGTTKTDTKSGALRALPGQRRLALTGTPLPNVWHELWTHLNFVAPDVFGSYWHFVQVLGNVTESFWGGKDISKDVVRKDIWDELWDRWVVSRPRAPSGVVWDFVPVQMSQPEVEAYTEMAKEWRVQRGAQVLDAATALARLTRLQQLAGGLGEWETYEDDTGRVVSNYTHADPSAKIDRLLEMVVGIDRAVVWTRFRGRAEYVARRLETAGIPPLLITGGISEKESTKRLAQFAEPGGTLVAVCVYGTISEGVNELVAASDVFFLDWLTAKDVVQAARRCDRPGQTRQVRCVTLYSEGTVDEVGIDREAEKVRPLRALIRDPHAWEFLERNPRNPAR